jgi:hypothetical protein
MAFVAAPTSSHSSPDDKRRFFNHMLTDVAIVRLHFHGLDEAVRMPKSKKTLCVIFEYGLNMPVPIPDLSIESSGVFAKLSFSGMQFQTFVPWDAVFAITDKETGRGIVWPSEIPEGLGVAVSPREGAMPVVVPEVPVPPAARQSHLRLVH